jgi:hypothetical protein
MEHFLTISSISFKELSLGHHSSSAYAGAARLRALRREAGWRQQFLPVIRNLTEVGNYFL